MFRAVSLLSSKRAPVHMALLIGVVGTGIWRQEARKNPRNTVRMMGVIPQAEEEESDEERLHWQERKAACGFCAFFLDSPCARSFKPWSRCVDVAKKGQDKPHTHYTIQLYTCPYFAFTLYTYRRERFHRGVFGVYGCTLSVPGI